LLLTTQIFQHYTKINEFFAKKTCEMLHYLLLSLIYCIITSSYLHSCVLAIGIVTTQITSFSFFV